MCVLGIKLSQFMCFIFFLRKCCLLLCSLHEDVREGGRKKIFFIRKSRKLCWLRHKGKKYAGFSIQEKNPNLNSHHHKLKHSHTMEDKKFIPYFEKNLSQIRCFLCCLIISFKEIYVYGKAIYD